MINVEHFREYAVRPILTQMATWQSTINTPAAENLLVGTAIQESRLTYLKQLGSGPALGVMQIEPNTHDDVWTNYLDFRQEAATMMQSLSAGSSHNADQLSWNMGYSVAIARMIYWRVPNAMPTDANDLEALGQYWKDHYNTASGAGTAEEWVTNYKEYT
ncbi:MAG: hypothetical protein OQK24_08295 [Magnetovibrio sp.]|nr:hypothetical protein [Magnetovibrio sp.]